MSRHVQNVPLRRRGSVLLAFVLATCAVAAPPDAGAITRKQATRAALKALKPQDAPGRTVVFGLPRPLKAGSTAGEAGPKPHAGVRRLRRRTWVFWEDLSYGALLQHPSVMLFVDHRSGKVIGRRRMQWYPIVNRRLAPFFITARGYRSDRYKVYESPAPRSRGGRVRARAADYPVATPRPADLAGDCLVTIGDFDAGGLKESRRAMEKFANEIGLRKLNAVPNLGGLATAVDTVVGEGCRDVFIYLAGHGTQPRARDFDPGDMPRVFSVPGGPRGGLPRFQPVNRRSPGGPAAVNVSPAFIQRRDGRVEDRSEYITPQDLSGLMKRRPGVEFKLKIESCFSGRFDDIFDSTPNLLIMELSSRFDEVSYFDLKRGTRVAKLNPNSKRPTGELIVDDTDNPDSATEFTNGDVHGLFEWGRDAPAGQDLLQAIDFSFTAGVKNNFSWLAGWTRPIIRRRQRTALATSPRAVLDSNDANEMFVRGDITRGGRRSVRSAQAAGGVDAIRVIVPPAGSDPRPIVNYICPSQLPNAETGSTRNPGDTLTCSGGSIPVPGSYELKLRTFPAPTPGMGGELHLRENGTFQGPFAIAGP